MNLQHEFDRMVRREPARVARMAIDVLRPQARTGSVMAALQLRSLSAHADPEQFMKKRGSPLRELAKYLRLSIESIRRKDGNWWEGELLDRIMKLPARPRDDFEAWIAAAWDLYMASLDNDLENDLVMWDLAGKALKKAGKTKGHGENAKNNIKRRLKVAARSAWCVGAARE